MESVPAHDPKLLDLKRIAEAGSDCGPFYNKGIQSVIEEIVNKKGFEPNAMADRILNTVASTRPASASIPADVQEFLDENH